MDASRNVMSRNYFNNKKKGYWNGITIVLLVYTYYGLFFSLGFMAWAGIGVRSGNPPRKVQILYTRIKFGELGVWVTSEKDTNTLPPSTMFAADGIRSQLEWNSTLSTAKINLPDEQNKYLRKVGAFVIAVV
jgi:hypothetical protein